MQAIVRSPNEVDTCRLAALLDAGADDRADQHDPADPNHDPVGRQDTPSARWRVDWCQDIGSTNADLLAAPFGDTPAAPRLLGACAQSHGRGRQGRPWRARPECALMFSIAFEREVERAVALTGWSIAAGVAIADALRAQVPDIRLKWPNDLQRAGRKCGGILVEIRRGGPRMGIERVVVGTGLNLLDDPGLSERAGQPATHLFDAVAAPDRTDLVFRLAGGLRAAWRLFAREGLSSARERWPELDALAGRPVRVTERGEWLFAGIAEGIDSDGRLRVRTDDGAIRPVQVGDVSVRESAASGPANPGARACAG